MAKDGSIYLLSRQINGDKGEVFMQNVTVFATSQTHAKALVDEQFARLRRISNGRRARVPGAARVRGRQGHARRAQDDHRGDHLLVAMDIAAHAARKLARRSSRRQFFKLLGAGSLGAGLFLTRHRRLARRGHRLRRLRRRAVQPLLLAGRPAATTVTGGQYHVQELRSGGGCPDGCNTGGEWFCCLTSGARAGCRFRCSECNCPAGCANPSCHCFTNLPMPCSRGCTPATSRALRVGQRAASREPGGLDGSRRTPSLGSSPSAPRAGSSSSCSEPARSAPGSS